MKLLSCWWFYPEVKTEYSIQYHWQGHLYLYIIFYDVVTQKSAQLALQELAPNWFITQTRQASHGGRPNKTLEALSPDRAALAPQCWLWTSYRTRTAHLLPVYCYSSSHSNKRCKWERQIGRRRMVESSPLFFLLVVRDGRCLYSASVFTQVLLHVFIQFICFFFLKRNIGLLTLSIFSLVDPLLRNYESYETGATQLNMTHSLHLKGSLSGSRSNHPCCENYEPTKSRKI